MAKKSNKKKFAKSLNVASDKPVSSIQKHPVLLAVLLMLVLLAIFYGDVTFGGKEFLQGDVYTNKSFEPFVADALEQGIYPLWCPYIFSGMPSYASVTRAPYVNIVDASINFVVDVVRSILGLPMFLRYIVNYLLLGSLVFLYLRSKGVNNLAALFSGIALIFMPQFVSCAVHGHSSKFLTAALIPLVLLLVGKLFEKRSLTFFCLASMAIGWQLMRAHIQVAYYSMMMIGLYFVYDSICRYRGNKDIKGIVTNGGLLVGVIVTAFVLCSVFYLSVLEYANFSIRGGGASGGLDYAYATNWSFSPLELTTFIIPSFVGFGEGTYWGQMPATAYPLYKGIVTLFLAGLAFVIKRDRTTIFFGIMAVLSLIISFGKTFPILYGPLFEFLPFFNKFRVPLMIQILMEFSVVVLAGLALHALATVKPEEVIPRIKKYVYGFCGVCGLLALITMMGENAYLGWVQDSGRGMAASTAKAAYEMAVGDALKMIFFLGGAVFLVFYFVKRRIGATLFGCLMIGLLVVDLWSVDFKMAKSSPAANVAAHFAETEPVRFLKRQEGTFRIYPVADNQGPNWYAYHSIQSIMGHHTARLRIYQNFLTKSGLEARNQYGLPGFLGKYYDVRMANGRPGLSPRAPDKISATQLQVDDAILKMLNVKYLTSFYPIPDPSFKEVVKGQPLLYEYSGALPRAWFVDEIKVLPNEDDFYKVLQSGRFDPAKTAMLTEQPEQEVAASTENQVNLTSFGIHEIEFSAKTATNAQMVVSEVYYPAGWKAYVDDVETKIYQADAILRSIQVPPGEHTVRFVFDPASFTNGIWISISTLTILLGLLVFDWKSRSKPLPAESGEVQTETETKMETG